MSELETTMIIREVEQLEEYLLLTRRFLHENPEIDAQEVQTSAFCRHELDKLGLTPQMVSENGFFAIIDSGNPGKNLVLRADMDGLALNESETNLTKKKLAVSKIPGRCHACGHDGHMAMLLGVAKILCRHIKEFSGRIILVFESGEETFCTTKQICTMLKREKADAIWAIHLNNSMPQGMISVDAGPRTTGLFEFDYTITGQGGHSSRPDQSVNPIFAAAAILSAFGGVVPLNLNPLDMGVVTPCIVRSGDARNVIPESCVIAGSGRFLKKEDYLQLNSKLDCLADGIARSYGCTCKRTHGYDLANGALPVINDQLLSDIAKTAILKIQPEANYHQAPWMASETFGDYGEVLPSILAFLGIANLSQGFGAPHHNGNFDFDEKVLEIGVKATVQFAVDFLKSSLQQSKKWMSDLNGANSEEVLISVL